jgi:hypothetical protein
LAVQILRTSTEWGSFSPSIGTKLPNDPVWSSGVITVQRVGGVPVERHRLDRANIQIDVWHDSKSSAHDIAQLARAILHRGEGSVYSLPSCYLTAVDDSLGLHSLPDPINLKQRYVCGVYLTLHQLS